MNMSAASAPTGSAALHDCDFNYGFILDSN